MTTPPPAHREKCQKAAGRRNYYKYMILTKEELFQLTRCSEWLYNEDFPKDKIGIRLNKKLSKFYSENQDQEKIFKNYIADIEQLTRDIADSIDLSLHDDAYRQIKERSKLKINFLHWFKKQIK